jgi:hypothetical protein
MSFDEVCSHVLELSGKSVAFDVRRGRVPQIKPSEDKTLRLEEAAACVGHGCLFVVPRRYSSPTSSFNLCCLVNTRVTMAAQK